jgi:hypothetical protein|tara:strand:+ start:238 stop:483 length:246 start_codon:yes stop_codon:yes gene_type:complete
MTLNQKKTLNKKIVQISKLSNKLRLHFIYDEGLIFEDAEGAVLEILKECMNPKNLNIEDCNVCIIALKSLLKNYEFEGQKS